jgi:DNA-binding GntR family transcriptional regulator
MGGSARFRLSCRQPGAVRGRGCGGHGGLCRQSGEFHKRLFSACDNRWLLWSWSSLYARQLRYRHTFADLGRFERGLHADYRSFLGGVVKRDLDQAERLWRENLEKVADFIENHLHPAVAEPSVTCVA